MIDFDALVFGPVYDTFGQPAVLTIGSSSYDLVVIDNTRGVTVDEGTAIGVQTVHPAADVRRSALNNLGIVFADLIDGEIAFGRHDLADQELSRERRRTAPDPDEPASGQRSGTVSADRIR